MYFICMSKRTYTYTNLLLLSIPRREYRQRRVKATEQADKPVSPGASCRVSTQDENTTETGEEAMREGILVKTSLEGE